MTLTRRAVLTQALTASAASVAAHASPLPAAAHSAGKAARPGAGAPADIEADLPAAERLLGLAYRPAQRKQLARGYGAVLKELAAVRALDLPNDVSPAVRFDPRIPGKTYRLPAPGVRGTAPDAGPFPSSSVRVALAPAWKQAAWLRAKKISSVELTRLTHRDDELKWQADMAWPNTWRRAHLFPAVEMVQIERLRRQAMVALDGFFDGIDASPSRTPRLATARESMR